MVSASHDALMEYDLFKRPMVVFMDVHGLLSAQDFQDQFSTALRLSRVVVVFLTAAALKGPMTDNNYKDGKTEDNCLIEWLLALFYEGYGKILNRQKQLPFHTNGKNTNNKY